MTQNPFTAVFDAQRTALEQSQSFAHEALEAQQTSISAIADVVETSGSLAESNAELTKGAIHAYFDALEASMPEEAAEFDDLRELVDEGFDSATEAQSQSLEAVLEALEESELAYEEFAANYSEVVDSSFDAALEAHKQVEENVEAVAEDVETAADEFDASA
ncbi:hypothetical protein C488_01869 [Natrinema pellirubrum DSM 15624]|uniref:Phasin family protein n=1 Tax=Natrinema pellirubrum (strain DSM 15624 / CIP 106293 / JCM 10476 / NCIMB 786 / 157) TaxID=797303 RepID=L0JL80_NATP1|nr:hypothetical protein [Natrinema pellirubrum]AGB31121.1 hypothetical protein Natpe_1215 [Natrinema pellirubrum DSM 15624]ELY81228.1 hypothetical protein C488_01869 [Natrinema pellirubrum DSM 15624]